MKVQPAKAQLGHLTEICSNAQKQILLKKSEGSGVTLLKSIFKLRVFGSPLNRLIKIKIFLRRRMGGNSFMVMKKTYFCKCLMPAVTAKGGSRHC